MASALRHLQNALSGAAIKRAGPVCDDHTWCQAIAFGCRNAAVKESRIMRNICCRFWRVRNSDAVVRCVVVALVALDYQKLAAAIKRMEMDTS
jgi:hypothetical protein